MIDPNKPIAAIVSPVCPNVELGWPKGSPSFPLVTVSVIGNSSEVVLDGRERFSGIVVQLDVWDNEPTRERCEQVACAVSDRMTAAGFIRQSAPDIEEDGLHRVCMTFRGTVDTETFEVYENS